MPRCNTMLLAVGTCGVDLPAVTDSSRRLALTTVDHVTPSSSNSMALAIQRTENIPPASLDTDQKPFPASFYTFSNQSSLSMSEKLFLIYASVNNTVKKVFKCLPSATKSQQPHQAKPHQVY